ncbi:MAG TPA: hypothetical protein VM266_12795, partial [Solirubrobacteraceae bacterium]|nr:hypothetical protein [Solirubrobacteraceae bacterium]
MRARAALAAAVAVVATGCGTGTDPAIRDGGVAVGEAVAVYSLMPASGPRSAAAQDAVLGQKLALAQAGGTAGGKRVGLVSLPMPRGRRALADATREAIRDPGIVAVIGDLDAASARITAPLLNAAGLLHVSPGATYTGLVAPVGEADPDAPGRYAPSGTATFAPVLPTDEAQAVAIAGAARRPLAVEAEAGVDARALAAAVRRRAGRTVPTARAATVVYVGEDPENAAGAVAGVLRENRRARVLLSGGLAGTDVLERLGPAAAARVALVTAAGPSELDTPFRDDFRARFGRDPGPFALVGHRAMRSVLRAIDGAAGDPGERRRVVDAFFA